MEEEHCSFNLANASLNETYEEDEVFFGPISSPEAFKIAKLRNRKTEIFDCSVQKRDESILTDGSEEELNSQAMGEMLVTKADLTFNLEKLQKSELLTDVNHTSMNTKENVLIENTLTENHVMESKDLSDFLVDFERKANLANKELNVENWENDSESKSTFLDMSDEVNDFKEINENGYDASNEDNTSQSKIIDILNSSIVTKERECGKDDEDNIISHLSGREVETDILNNDGKIDVENGEFSNEKDKIGWKILDNSNDSRHIARTVSSMENSVGFLNLKLNSVADLAPKESEGIEEKDEHNTSEGFEMTEEAITEKVYDLNLPPDNFEVQVAEEELKVLTNLTACLEDSQYHKHFQAPNVPKNFENGKTNETIKSLHMSEKCDEAFSGKSSTFDSKFESVKVHGLKSASLFADKELEKKDYLQKRESYFSSLELINVNDTCLYGSFCVEDGSHNAILPENYIMESQFEEQLGVNSSSLNVVGDDCKNAAVKTVLPDVCLHGTILEKINSENVISSNRSSMESEKKCLRNSLEEAVQKVKTSSNNLEKEYKNSSFAESWSYSVTEKENPNNAIIFDSLSKEMSEVKINSGHSDLSVNSSKNDDLYKESDSSQTPSATIIPSHFKSPVPEKQFNNTIEETQFNDTIEEIELLLKYGVDYLENLSQSQKNEKSEILNTTQHESDIEGSIVSPKRASLSSYESAHSFNPNFDSTHTSTTNSATICKTDVEKLPSKGNNEKSNVLESKKIPPQKPPRQTSPNKAVTPNKAITVTPKCSNLGKESIFHKGPSPNFMRYKGTFHQAQSHVSVQKTSAVVMPKNFDKHLHSSSKAANAKTCKLPVPIFNIPTSVHTPSRCFNTPISSNTRPLNPDTSPGTPKTNFAYPSSGLSKSAKVDRLMIPKQANKPFLTPQNKQTKDVKKLQMPKILNTMPHKVRGLSIVSPVAKYLQENPPPPLVTNVKPRLISPHRTFKGVCKLADSNLVYEPCLTVPNDLNDSNVRLEETKKRIQDGIKKLASKVKAKSPLREANPSSETVIKSPAAVPSTLLKKKVTKFVLPACNYHQATAVQLEANKENRSSRREIPSDRPPTSVLKHKGRVMVAKQLMEEGILGSPLPTDETPGTPESRVSFVEISVCEPHYAHHTNTLH